MFLQNMVPVWQVTLHHILRFDTEDGSSRFSRNVGICRITQRSFAQDRSVIRVRHFILPCILAKTYEDTCCLN
jgi:hypothetical protein